MYSYSKCNVLKCFCSDVDLIMNKRSELLAVLENEQPDEICLIEVLPKNCRFTVPPSELHILKALIVLLT